MQKTILCKRTQLDPKSVLILSWTAAAGDREPWHYLRDYSGGFPVSSGH